MTAVDPKLLLEVLPKSRWIGAQFARAAIAVAEGASAESVARALYREGSLTLTKAKETVASLANDPLESLLTARTKTGSAENPITKLFPAAITERQFVEALDVLRAARPSVQYRDDREAGHTLVDFTLTEGDDEVPVNVKNAGTRFENAATLVGLSPDDCIPIPAYKAHDAVEKVPNLLYAVCVNYGLLAKIRDELLSLLTPAERHVWKILNAYGGTLIRDAEDQFIYGMVSKYWDRFSTHVPLPDFRIVSARKAIRVLQTIPRRTPGIGLRAWGTGASAEVNVHLSVKDETKSWSTIHERIVNGGLADIVQAVNRKRTEVVFDPEI